MPEEYLHAERQEKCYRRKIQEVLKGVQRAPSLLLMKPDDLCNLNLQHYTVLDCEPLHDLKGHLLNLFHDLNCQVFFQLPSEQNVKHVPTGQVTVLHLFVMVHTHASRVNWKVHLL